MKYGVVATREVIADGEDAVVQTITPATKGAWMPEHLPDISITRCDECNAHIRIVIQPGVKPTLHRTCFKCRLLAAMRRPE